MRHIVFDIETANTFPGLAKANLERLELSVVGVYDSHHNAYSSYTKEELPAMWSLIEHADLLVGFNSDVFDIPLLNKYYPGDLTHIPSLDILSEVQKVLGRRIRLQTLAEATLGKGKSGDGLKAVEWWREGRVDKVREYCLEDVRLTKELYDYAIKNGILKYKELREIRDMKIDTSLWGRTPSSTRSITYALPL